MGAYLLFTTAPESVMADSAPPKVKKTDADWQKELTPEQYYVTRQHGTERPFSSPLNVEKREGVYVCSSCGTPLFKSDTKYESGSGWPSFWQPISPDAVTEHEDFSMLSRRVEIRCANCGAHLGHGEDRAGHAPRGLPSGLRDRAAPASTARRRSPGW